YQVTYHEQDIRDGEGDNVQHASVETLGQELREVAVQHPAPPVGAVELHHLVAHHAVPARAVVAIGEDADGEHTPQAAHTMHRDRAHAVVDTDALEEEHAVDDDDAGDGADREPCPGRH